MSRRAKGRIGKMRASKKGGDIVITDFKSPAAEAIQKLQTNIAFANPDKPIQVLGITSAIQGEGKSTTTVNLANVYALRGLKIVVVNLDIRRPSIHRYYHIQNKVGIVDYVSGDVESVDDIVVHTPGQVDIINAGSSTPFATKILQSNKLPTLFEELRKRYDMILVDTAPVLLVTDALLCAKFVDAFIFVCAQHISKKKEVADAVKNLRQNGIPVIGTVMTRVTDFTDVSGNKDYYYYSSHEHEEASK